MYIHTVTARLCHTSGVLLCQARPFRRGVVVDADCTSSVPYLLCPRLAHTSSVLYCCWYTAHYSSPDSYICPDKIVCCTMLVIPNDDPVMIFQSRQLAQGNSMTNVPICQRFPMNRILLHHPREWIPHPKIAPLPLLTIPLLPIAAMTLGCNPSYNPLTVRPPSFSLPSLVGPSPYCTQTPEIILQI